MRTTLLFMTLALACQGQQPRGLQLAVNTHRKAFVLGNKNYSEQPLGNTLNDANDVAKALRELSFDVDLATDLSKGETEKRFDRFVKGLQSGDIAWFYYSGHGFQIDGENYLVPVDFRAESVAEARMRGVAFSGIKTAMEKSPAQLSILVLDACRNNPFENRGLGFRGMALLEAGLGAYIAFAASPGQTAVEYVRERNGLFTGRLLEALRQPLKISDLFRQVRKEVYDSSNHKQLPYIHDQIIADISLRQAPPETPQANSILSAADVLFDEAKSLYHSGRCDQALAKLDQVVRTNPTNAYVQNALGLVYACLGMPSRALEHFSRAIDVQPNYAAAYSNRGQTFVSNGQFELAIDDFNWALEQEPDNGALYWRRGLAKLGLRRYEDAQKDFTASIALDSSSPYGFHGRGRVSFYLGKYREALVDFDSAIARKHDFAEAIDYRARTQAQLDRAK